MRLMLLAITLAATVGATAATYTVNSSADTTDGVCDVANCTLREAIAVAVCATGSQPPLLWRRHSCLRALALNDLRAEDVVLRQGHRESLRFYGEQTLLSAGTRDE